MATENKGLTKHWNVLTGQYEYLTFQENYAVNIQSKTNRPLIPLLTKFKNDEDKALAFVINALFENDQTNFNKVLWRMGSGSRSKCYQIAGELIACRYAIELDEETFDLACAEINDGCEVEWITE